MGTETAERPRTVTATRAVLVTPDPEHQFLLECLLRGSVDVIDVATSPGTALPLVLTEEPALLVLDLALHRVSTDTGAAARIFRAITDETVVLEIGLSASRSDAGLHRTMRGNSLDVQWWRSCGRARDGHR